MSWHITETKHVPEQSNGLRVFYQGVEVDALSIDSTGQVVRGMMVRLDKGSVVKASTESDDLCPELHEFAGSLRWALVRKLPLCNLTVVSDEIYQRDNLLDLEFQQLLDLDVFLRESHYRWKLVDAITGSLMGMMDEGIPKMLDTTALTTDYLLNEDKHFLKIDIFEDSDQKKVVRTSGCLGALRSKSVESILGCRARMKFDHKELRGDELNNVWVNPQEMTENDEK